MVRLRVVELAAVLVDSSYRSVQEAAVKVLYNLSFDTSLR